MGQVNVRVNGYTHAIGCRDGEEAHVTALVAQIEEKARTIRAMGGQFSEARMLLHVALLLADEVGDLRADVARLRGGAGPSVATAGSAGAEPGAAANPELAARLARIAERIEGLSRTLEQA